MALAAGVLLVEMRLRARIRRMLPFRMNGGCDLLHPVFLRRRAVSYEETLAGNLGDADADAVLSPLGRCQKRHHLLPIYYSLLT